MAAPIKQVSQTCQRLLRGIFPKKCGDISSCSSIPSLKIARFKHCISSAPNTSTLLCSVCRLHYSAQQRRTFFEFFKRGQPSDEVAEEELPYSVVTLGTVGPTRHVPDSINKPEYAVTGKPSKIHRLPVLLSSAEMEKMRTAGAMARKILDIGASHVKPGVTTDFIDEIIHSACLEHNVYPSTLNYLGFPKSVCTSVNNVIAHGIPDDRPLQEGDIINIDVSVFVNDYHGDVSETYTVGVVDEGAERLIEVARRCRDEAIRKCASGVPIAFIGTTIELIAQEAGFSVCRSLVGHGIGRQFHCKPDIWHYANRYPEMMLQGMAFTIEPIILERIDSIIMGDDGWTALAKRHTRSAQFEHTVLLTDSGREVPTASPEEDFKMKPENLSSEDLEDELELEASKGRSKKDDWGF